MISLQFTGGAEMATRLAELSVSVNVQRRAVRAAAEPMRRDMSILAPHEPGKPDLRDAMVISPVTKRDDDLVFPQEIAVAVGPSTKGFYGFFQEFGTAFHGAQPFARPAFDQNIATSLRILQEALWASIQTAAKRQFSAQAASAGTSRARSTGVGL